MGTCVLNFGSAAGWGAWRGSQRFSPAVLHVHPRACPASLDLNYLSDIGCLQPSRLKWLQA